MLRVIIVILLSLNLLPVCSDVEFRLSLNRLLLLQKVEVFCVYQQSSSVSQLRRFLYLGSLLALMCGFMLTAKIEYILSHYWNVTLKKLRTKFCWREFLCGRVWLRCPCGNYSLTLANCFKVEMNNFLRHTCFHYSHPLLVQLLLVTWSRALWDLKAW